MATKRFVMLKNNLSKKHFEIGKQINLDVEGRSWGHCLNLLIKTAVEDSTDKIKLNFTGVCTPVNEGGGRKYKCSGSCDFSEEFRMGLVEVKDMVNSEPMGLDGYSE